MNAYHVLEADKHRTWELEISQVNEEFTGLWQSNTTFIRVNDGCHLFKAACYVTSFYLESRVAKLLYVSLLLYYIIKY